MHTTSLRKVGGSIMLAVPPALLDILNLAAGAKVGVEVDGGRLVIQPTSRPRYTLNELIAQCDTAAPPATEDQAWLDVQPLGRELL